MKLSKYLVRSSDYSVFELDESNNCYRPYQKTPTKNRQSAYTHFTYENLVHGYDFFAINEDELEYYLQKNDYEIRFYSWQCRSDGHGGCKGGTREEYEQYLKAVEEYKKRKI